MTEIEVHGPIDFVLLEFEEERLNGGAAEELLTLVEQGTIRLYDVLVVGKSAAGEIYAVDLTDLAEQLAGFEQLVWARTGLLNEEDVAEAASVLEPGRLAVVIVFENTWAIPFVAAARASGGELVASGRIPAQDVMDALEALEALDALETTS